MLTGAFHQSTLLVALLLATGTCAWAESKDVAGVPRVVDGDTIEIVATKIRLDGIDAPETDQLCLNSQGQSWTCGIEARDRLAQKAKGNRWICHIHGADKYGRALATCEANGENINLWLVLSGWALSFTRYSHAYDVAEQQARAAKAGLWAGAFIAPWDWRERGKNTVIHGALSVPANAQGILLSAASAAEAPSPDCTIKGNMNRQGQCIYHFPGGRWYSSVKMDISKGKRWFCSAEEAEAAGCRAAKQLR